MKIKQKEIKYRTNLILFGLLPVLLFVIGFIVVIKINLGFPFGLIFFVPSWILVIISHFFVPEKHVSIFKRIPERIKNIFLIVLLIFILGIVPIIGVINIIDFSKFPLFSLKETYLFGFLLCVCSGIIWVMILYALDFFRSIRYYVSRYFLFGIGLVLAGFLFIRWCDSDDFIYLVMSFFAIILSVGWTARKEIYI